MSPLPMAAEREARRPQAARAVLLHPGAGPLAPRVSAPALMGSLNPAARAACSSRRRPALAPPRSASTDCAWPACLARAAARARRRRAATARASGSAKRRVAARRRSATLRLEPARTRWSPARSSTCVDHLHRALSACGKAASYRARKGVGEACVFPEGSAHEAS